MATAPSSQRLAALLDASTDPAELDAPMNGSPCAHAFAPLLDLLLAAAPRLRSGDHRWT